MKYGRLTIIKEVPHANKHKMVLCVCDCGTEKVIQQANVRSGHTQSCGCIWSEQKHLPRKIKHGLYRSPTYKSWQSMKNRCTYDSVDGSEYYKGRGITFVKEWQEFENFLKDMGQRPVGTTLDRIDVNGNYGPLNCKWSTPKEQAENKRNTIFLSRDGESKTINEWSRVLGIPRATIYSRKQERKMSDEDSLRII